MFNVKYRFTHLQLFDVKFLFQITYLFKQNRMAVYGQASLVSSPGKMITCYLRGRNKFLRYRNLCTSILKCEFTTEGVKLTRLLLFEVSRVPQL